MFLANGLVDYTTFEKVNLLNFSIASTELQFTGSLLIPSISSWLIYNTSGLYYHVEVIFVTIILSLYTQAKEFFTDLVQVLHFNFRINIIPSAINWAIATDITYSLYYVVPSVLLVLAQRWEVGREKFLDQVLSISGHPRGVLYAVGEGLMKISTGVRDFLKEWIGGRKG